MAWKQTRLLGPADDLVIHYIVLKALDGLHALIEWTRIERLFKEVHNAHARDKAWHLTVKNQ